MKTDEVMTLGRSGHLGMRAETIPVPRQLLWDMVDELRARMPEGEKKWRFRKPVTDLVVKADDLAFDQFDAVVIDSLRRILDLVTKTSVTARNGSDHREKTLRQVFDIASKALGRGGHGRDGELRPEVLEFARAMEERLRANDHKEHWRLMALSDLESGLYEEVTELQEELDRLKVIDADAVLHEAADVANFAMMIADRVGCISGTQGRLNCADRMAPGPEDGAGV